MAAATKSKSVIGWRLRAAPSISIGDMKSKDFLMYRCVCVGDMSMTKGDMSDCYQKFVMVLKKIIIILYIVEI